jgi:hypothetical protein
MILEENHPRSRKPALSEAEGDPFPTATPEAQMGVSKNTFEVQIIELTRRVRVQETGKGTSFARAASASNWERGFSR